MAVAVDGRHCTSCGEFKSWDCFWRYSDGRGTNGRRAKCGECLSADQRRRYDADPERFRAYAREWGDRNRAQKSAMWKAWASRNRERVRQQGRRYATTKAVGLSPADGMAALAPSQPGPSGRMQSLATTTAPRSLKGNGRHIHG